MTQEDKELLIKDLSARLPYGVKINVDYIDFNRDGKLFSINNNEELILSPENGYSFDATIEKCKPYLFPMSSMTDEQRKELEELYLGYYVTCQDIDDDGYIWDENVFEMIPCTETDDWLNAHHFDHRGLIPKNLANDATDKNVY